MSLQIRRATLADVDALSAIAIATYNETWGDSYPPKELHDFLQAHYSSEPQRIELSDPRSAIWLLLDGDAVVGYLAAGANTLPHTDAREGDIELKRFYILAAHQNGGHGARMMDAFMAWLDQPHRRTLWVGVWEKLRRAALLRALWLQQSGRVRLHRRRYPRPRVYPSAAVITSL